MDLTPFFQKYEALVLQVDAVFEKVQNEFGECVRCRLGCADCCHALFDMTLVEALYIKARFDELFKDAEREVLIERANKADRQIYKLKRKAFLDHEAGRPESDIVEEMAAQRVRCPALDENERCAMYAIRPLTCRIYGIPTVIGGKAHTCGISGFEEGKSYPTVKLDAIYQRLYEISQELAQAIQSKYPALAEMLVPLSMALLTDYSEDYLGIAETKECDRAE
jgi:Fe-S-cluster containining protein